MCGFRHRELHNAEDRAVATATLGLIQIRPMFYFIIFVCAGDGTHSFLVPGTCSTTDKMPRQRVQSVLAASTLAKTPDSVHFCSIGLQVIFNFFSIFFLSS